MSNISPFSIHGDTSLPAVLMLHGFLGSKDDWEGYGAFLGDEFCCIAVDLPGHGENIPDDESSYSFANCAHNLSCLLEKLEIKKVTLCGYSMGGRLALYFALTYPKLCNSLIIESASPGLKNEDEREERRKQDYELAEQLEYWGVQRFVDEWYKQPLFATLRDHEPSFESLLVRRKMNSESGAALSLRIMGTGSQVPLWEQLSEIRIPVLLIAGALDSKYSALAKEMAGLCPAGEACIIENAGHNVHVEQAEKYADMLRKFLSKKQQVRDVRD